MWKGLSPLILRGARLAALAVSSALLGHFTEAVGLRPALATSWRAPSMEASRGREPLVALDSPNSLLGLT